MDNICQQQLPIKGAWILWVEHPPRWARLFLLSKPSPPHPDGWLKGLERRTCWTTGFQKTILPLTLIIYLPTYTLAVWSNLPDGDQTSPCYPGKRWKPFYQIRAPFNCLVLVVSLMSFSSSHWELRCSSHKCLLLRKTPLPSRIVHVPPETKSRMPFFFFLEEEIISTDKPDSTEFSVQELQVFESAVPRVTSGHGGRVTPTPPQSISSFHMAVLPPEWVSVWLSPSEFAVGIPHFRDTRYFHTSVSHCHMTCRSMMRITIVWRYTLCPQLDTS